MTFKIHLPKEPTGTSQMKGLSTRRGRVQFYEKPQVRDQRLTYVYALKPHKPKEPFKGPVSVTVVFSYPQRKTQKMKEPLEWKPTVPDLDNLLKLFLDAMTQCRFWEDDKQIVHMEAKKLIAKGQEDFQIIVSINEVTDKSNLLIEEGWGVFHYEG
jgi:Holliday junction resolvase RusA-like endonuclease